MSTADNNNAIIGKGDTPTYTVITDISDNPIKVDNNAAHFKPVARPQDRRRLRPTDSWEHVGARQSIAVLK